MTTNGQGAPQAPWGNASRHDGALRHIRICDLSGQLAGAGATRVLAAFGAQVIRIEDPVTKGLWDIVRQIGPYIDGDRGPDGGSGFNNHNVEKLGITLNLRTERGKELLAELVRGVERRHRELRRRRDGAARLRLRAPARSCAPTSSTCRTAASARPGRTGRSSRGARSPRRSCGLTHTSGLPDQEPAGWGYSYMDHTGGYFMAIALLAALYHQRRTGEGQWVDLACTEAGIALTGPAVARRHRERPRRCAPTAPCTRNRSHVAGDGAARHLPVPRRRLAGWPSPAATTTTGARWPASSASRGRRTPRCATLAGRLDGQDELDAELAGVDAPARPRRGRRRGAGGRRAVRAGDPPAGALRRRRRDQAWGLWPTVTHTKHGAVRVDGLPVHLSAHRLAASSGAARCSARTTSGCSARCSGCRPAEIGRLAEDGVI